VSTLSQAGLRRVLVVLCVTEITSWGVLFYAFTVLAPEIGATRGWSASTVTAAFSVSQITSALSGIVVGRVLDRIGPRPVMTAGSTIAVPALVVIATAGSLPWFFAGWFLAGLAMSGTLYSPAFAALTRWWGLRRVTALTAVTLVAGLASTVFAPLTAMLDRWFDYRETYLILAAVLGLVTIPLHAIGLRGPWPAAQRHDQSHAPDQVARSRPFVMLAVALALSAFSIYGVVIIQVPLLIERGLSTGTAALALGLGGVGQLCGRIGYRRLTAATSVRTRTAIVLGAGSASIALLAVLPGPAALLIAGAMVVGVTRGVFTLLQATAVTDRWGPEHYGRLNGLLGAPILTVVALAPWLCTALAEGLGGYPAVFGILSGLTALGAVLATASTRESQMIAAEANTKVIDTTGAGSTARSAVGTNPTT
jgi:MFS family permease